MRPLTLMVIITFIAVIYIYSIQTALFQKEIALETKIQELGYKQDVDRDYFSKTTAASDFKDIDGYIKLKYQIMPACFVEQKRPAE